MIADRALAILRGAFGSDAFFKDGQLEAIVQACGDQSRTLVVQKTGWGKSIVYFVACRIRRELGHGPALLVSPLLSLMRNQLDAAARLGVRAESINSTNVEDWSALTRELLDGGIDILLISPERLGNPHFRDQLMGPLLPKAGLLVIDEAHCISDWGHDFRPDYRRIIEVVGSLPASTPILATTATANDRVIQDIRDQLGTELEVYRGPLLRESLRVRALRLDDQAQRLAWLGKYIPKLSGTGIVYALTVNDANRVAEWLQCRGVDAHAYHSDLPTERKQELERQFAANEVKVLVATTALGMGYDKPDVSFVIHFQRPGSIISYYQQIGRAGRMLASAEVVLLTGFEDDEITRHFIDSAFPTAECFKEIQSVLKDRTLPQGQIVGKMNFRQQQVLKALKLMEVEQAVEHAKEGYRITDPEWSRDRLRSEEITRHRYLELEQMTRFVDDAGCRMMFLARALDDPTAQPCGRCDNCTGKHLPLPEPSDVADAIRFLRSARMSIEPKKMWPAGFMADGAKKISDDQRNEPGIVLSVYGDAGWGRIVARCKYEQGIFTDDLVQASAEILRECALDWLTWVPSYDGGGPVRDFACRLAEALRIPAHPCVAKIRQNAAQKTMQNSTHQVRNVYDCFEVKDPPRGACLLVDDVVDSGWTLTAIGAKLRQAGVTRVVPFALASSRPREDAS